MSQIIRFVRLWPGRITTEKALKLYPHFMFLLHRALFRGRAPLYSAI